MSTASIASAPSKRRGLFSGFRRHWRILTAAYVISTVWFSLVVLIVYAYLHR